MRTVLDVNLHVGDDTVVTLGGTNPDNVWVTVRAPGVDVTLFVDHASARALEGVFRRAALACRYPDCPSAPGSTAVPEEEELVEITESVA